MAMDIFTANPRSFTMDRRSPLATKLKASVSEKLIEFLGNYSDDVLAEYIVVLVCNGKHQNQARDDLEAFLGKQSGEFVSWLWDLLLKIVQESHIPTGSSDVKDVPVTSGYDGHVDSGKRDCRLSDLQNHTIGNADNLLSKDGMKYRLSTYAPKPVSSDDVEVSEGFQRWQVGFGASLDEVNTMEVLAQTCRSEISEKSGSAEDNRNEVLKYGSSRVKVSSGISAGGEQSMQYVDQYEKMAKRTCNGLHHQLLHSPKRDPVSTNVQSVMTENPFSKPFSATSAAGTRLSSRVVDSLSHPNVRPRGNVWDRLGKPCEDNTMLRGKKTEVHDVNVIKRKIPEHNGKGLDQHNLMLFVPGGRLNRSMMGEVPVLDNSCGIVISNTNPDEYRRPEHGLHTTCSLHDVTNSSRKRQFGEIGPGPANDFSVSLANSKSMHLQDKETFKEFQRSLSAKCSRSQSLKIVASETRNSDGLDTYHALRSSDIALNPRSNKMSQTKFTTEASEAIPTETLVSINGPLVAKSEPINIEEGVNLDLKPEQTEVLDVKLRLHQIEMEMSILRSKQVEMRNDGKKLSSLSSYGELNHTEEDTESRTVFVTNVHFAATKEALSLHFGKCGVVVKVVILNDTVTAQSKGSAYITFASKESAEKAVALSGTSFWSRTLKVVKKADMTAVTSPPAQLAGKPSQSWFPQSNRKVILQRPYYSSHLQWRRDQPLNPGNSVLASGSGLEASRTFEPDDINSGNQPFARSLKYARTTEAGSTEAPAAS